MCRIHAKVLIIILSVLGSINATAQTGGTSNPTNQRENNPYSKFGIGEFINGNNTILRGMGNITSAYASPYAVNSDNPASYSFLQRTTFEAGGTASSRTMEAQGLSYQTGTASVSYLNLAVPIGEDGGLCFGFRPHTRVYYALADTIFNSPIGMAGRSYNGEGGLNYAYLGAARKYKGLSVGFNLGYLFGTLRHTSALVPLDSLGVNRAYTSEFTNYNRIGGLNWKAGVMYERKLDSNYSIRIGGTLALQQNITEKLNAFQISSYNFGDTFVSDTSTYVGEQKGKLKLPLSYSIGVLLSRNDKWSVGLDYTATRWSGFRSSPDSSLQVGVGSGSYKISLGGEITPDINSIRRYLARATYRVGAYYGTDYLNLNSTALPCYGLTAGLSLPFKRSLSRIHMAADFGRMGTSANNLILTNYIKFTMGFTFNDKWFIPRKYD